MKQPLRRLLAGLTLATAAAAGTLAATHSAIPHRTDTAQAAADIPADTGWGIPPQDTGTVTGTVVTTFDTGWG